MFDELTLVLPKRCLNKKITIDEHELLFENIMESFRYPITAAPLVFAYCTQFAITRVILHHRIMEAIPSPGDNISKLSRVTISLSEIFALSPLIG